MAKLRGIKKKGIFFTFIAITLMSLFVLVLTPQADISLQKDEQAIKTRINSIDSYATDLENSYFESVLRATTYKTILSLVFYINSTGSYLTDLDSSFHEVLLNGTINKVPIDTITGKAIMEGNTLPNWTSRVIEASKDTLNVNTTISIINASVFQTSPWSIDSELVVNFTIKSNVAEWERLAVVKTTMGIEGLHDPAYLAGTNGAYTNQIKKSTVEFDDWNISEVREHIRNGTYLHWQDSKAPNFLMRLANDTTNSSCCGIESIVNPNNIAPSDQHESYSDYLFWGHKLANDCTQLYNITGLWDEFEHLKLDFEHVILYNISPQDTTITC